MAKEVTEILEAMTAEDLKRRREIAEKLFSEHFSSHEARKTFIREFAAELREARKNAVETGNEEQTALDEERQIAFLMIFRFCPLSIYRKQLGDVIIEGLKYQQKDIKRYCFEYAHQHISDGFIDVGWWSKLLNKKYVSKYGWKLLRLNASLIPVYAMVALTESINFWANDDLTRKKWKELDDEFGTHFDFVAEFTAK